MRTTVVPGDGSSSSGTVTPTKVPSQSTLTRDWVPRFSATTTVPRRTGPVTSPVATVRYSGRMPTVTSAPAGAEKVVAGNEPLATVTEPTAADEPLVPEELPATLPGRRFIGVEPMKLATKVLAGRAKTSRGEPSCRSLPDSITAIRSASASASAWSWVTKTVVMPSSRCSFFRKVRASSRSRASRFDSGSSRSSTLPSEAIARASATRCCWPPDNWPGLRSSSPCSDSAPAVRSAAAVRVAMATRRTFRG